MIDFKPQTEGVTVEAVNARPPVCLDLGCGANKAPGFLGVDAYETADVDVVQDLLSYPWPWRDGEVDEVRCSHFLEHVPGGARLRFFDELWRVLKVGGKATFITPSCDSNRAIQDPSHCWPPVCPEFYLYVNRGWREANKLTHGAYDVKCNFDAAVAVSYAPDVGPRADEFRTFAMTHYRNATLDLHVTLTRLE